MIFFPLSDENPTEKRPWMTWSLIVACSLIFTWQLFLTPEESELLYAEFGMTPSFLLRGTLGTEILPITPPWITIISSIFLHGSIWHFFSNMLFLWIFGDNVEDSMGSWRFIIFYLLSGIIGCISHALVMPLSEIPMIGASGAIAGVLGGYLILYPKARIRTFSWFIIFFKFIKIPAWIILSSWLISQFFFLSTNVKPSQEIAYMAHIGGFISGMVFILWFKKPEKTYLKKEINGLKLQIISPLTQDIDNADILFPKGESNRQSKTIMRHKSWF